MPWLRLPNLHTTLRDNTVQTSKKRLNETFPVITYEQHTKQMVLHFSLEILIIACYRNAFHLLLQKGHYLSCK